MWHNGAPGPGPLQPAGATPLEPGGYLQAQPLAIHFLLSLPATRIGVGVFSVDVLERLLGFKVEQLLQPMMTGPARARPSLTGPTVSVFPMAIPAGEGISLNLGSWGELGIGNDRGYLCLSVPLAAAGWVTPRVVHMLARGPEEGLSASGLARVALFWLRLTPGMRASVPVSLLGEIGLEAV